MNTHNGCSFYLRKGDYIVADSVKKSLVLIVCILCMIVNPIHVHASTQGEITYIDKEISMIEHVVMNEVGYCSEESMVTITNIIFNRVNDDRFPDTISEVLHQENQFTAIQNYYNCRLEPTVKVKEIVERVLKGEDNSMGALYYYAPKYVKNLRTINWFESLEFLFELDGQRYFK